MADDRSPQDEDLSTAGSFEKWLDRQATKEGISREQLFEQLISSYWTLNEMEQLLGGLEKRKFSLDDPSGSESGGESGGDLDDVRERLEELESELEAEVERRQSLDTVAEVTTDRLTELEGRLEDLESDVETIRGSLDRKHKSVVERTDALEEKFEHEKESRVAEQQELATEQNRISSRLDSEFENLETILTYLVSRTDELKDDVSNVVSKYDGALTRLRWERDALDSLKHEAATLSVQSGECESCEEVIDLGLLSRPYCPECETTLTGLEERQKWLFFSDVVVTTDNASQRRSEPNSGRPSTPAGRSRSANRDRRSREEADTAGDTPRPGGVDKASAGRGRNSESDVATPGSTPDRTDSVSKTSGPDDADDTGWADSRFEYGVVEEGPSGEVSERRRRTEDGATSTSENQTRGRSRGGTRTVDEGDGSEESKPGERTGDSPDDTESPFGDISDLMTDK